MFSSIDFNPEFQQAWDLLEKTKQNLFITGKAGTGKSTLLKYFRKKTKKTVVVLAPTGVAALNIKGQTIHSFFKFPPQITPELVSQQRPSQQFLSLIKQVDLIIIDEVSMVRADLMDCMNLYLQLALKNETPFGGKQLVLMGDLYQLPPVVATPEEKEMFTNYYSSPYFFSAVVTKQLNLEIIELEKIYRQDENDFIELLNKIRNNQLENEDIEYLNQRYQPDFTEKRNKFYITLTTTNAAAANLNQQKLKLLKGRTHSFKGTVSGKFEAKNHPTNLKLDLKKSAQVMMLNNDGLGRWVNGSVGQIVALPKTKKDPITVKLHQGPKVLVKPYKWEVSQYYFNEKERKLKSEAVGSFNQYPLKLAWAVTIHKSQGKTFDQVIIDIGRGTFSHGQVYVALSRCTNWQGLVIKTPILAKHIWTDYRILKYLTDYQYQKAALKMPIPTKAKKIKLAIDHQHDLEIIYLKADNTKSKRTITPQKLARLSYKGKQFSGLKAFCHQRQDNRVFKLERILDIL